ncbi:hypothetical protein PAMA_021459 [Pampus argenteus]
MKHDGEEILSLPHLSALVSGETDNCPLLRPQNGSMILYNRKKVKYRKDGYCWKKRKDGKTTREDHMKLKVQGVEQHLVVTKSTEIEAPQERRGEERRGEERRGEEYRGEERRGVQRRREEGRGEKSNYSSDIRPSLSHHVLLTCQSNSGLLNFTLN